MSNPRTTGLALLLIGVLVLVGNTMDVLPPEAFFAGMLTYTIGGYLFFMGSRRALKRAELRTARKLNPKLGNSPGQDYAQRQADHVVNPHAARSVADDLPEVKAEPAAPLATPNELVLNEIEVSDEGEEDDFHVATDVSHPVELHDRRSLGDELAKLSKLHEQGVISSEELAIAKAKLLG